MKHMAAFVVGGLLISPVLTWAEFVPRIKTDSVCSSTQGKKLTDGGFRSMIVNLHTGAAASICVARMNGDCAALTSCIGAPIAAGSGVSFLGKEDGDGQYCVIAASGSTCVTYGVNEK